jgi:WD40 repeat protein
LFLLFIFLQILNFLYRTYFQAGRTFNDINQYPVFPWVLANYTSDTLDLTDPNNFRDLTKPVGALNPERLRFLLDRFEDLDGFREEEKFLYGSHYSSPGTVLYYMIRQEPFTSMHIELQSGRFDVPDRLFHDISGCWKCCLKLTSDVKELVPEFFTCPEIFLNLNNFPLGSRQDGARVSDVILPPWANGSAYEFVRKHALALESEYVSQNLNHWIDLIFGFKQRGPAAAAANNVFHFLSYEGSVDLDSITNRVDREATESHIQNFGQTPSQLLLKDPHPTRYTIADTWSPIISDSTNCRLLRCWTPSKQFGLSDSCGAVMSIHILTEQIVVVYADMSVGSYRWYHKGPGSAPFLFKPDKLRWLGTRTLSLSPTAVSGSSSIKDRAASSNYRARVIAKQLEHSNETADVIIPIQSSFFGVTVGGYLKENLRKSVSAGSRSIEGSPNLDSSYYLVSCGYWDGTVKIHTLDGLRLKCSATGGHRGPIVCLSIGECGGMMVTGGLDATCRIWIIDHPNLSLALADARARTSHGYVTEGSQERLLSCCHVLWGHITPISCVAISSDLDIVVSGSVDGMICVHMARKGKFLRSINVNDSTSHDAQSRKKAVRKIVLHSQGFVAHTEDKMLHSCTINGAILSSVSAEDRLHAMVVSSDGQMLITGGDKFAVVIRAISTLSIRSVLDLSKHGPIRCIALTPAEHNPAPQFIYIGTNDGLVTIVDSELENSS